MRCRTIPIRLAIFLALAAGPALAQQAVSAGNLTAYRNAGFGFSVSHPAELFRPHPGADDASVRNFGSLDGSAQFSVSAYRNSDAQREIAPYKEKVLTQDDYSGLTYQPTGETWFVLSGIQDDIIYYEKYILSCNWRVMNVLLITYRRDDRATYDAAVTTLEKSFRPGNGSKNPPESCV